jgi:two-component system LytT family response regulator
VERDYSCYIVDDNKIDRLTTVSFVKKYHFLKIQGVFEDARTTLEAANKCLPDVLFADIDMPGINGLELRNKLDKIPACIFITSFPDYAVSGFEENALDFIVKPIEAGRFEKAMKRLEYFLIIYFLAALNEHSLVDDHLFIKQGHEQIKIRLGDILYLEALKDYTAVVTPERKYYVLSPLGSLLKEKAFHHFMRIHRSYAVQKRTIHKVTSHEVMVGNTALPIGRTFKDVLNHL